MALSYDVFEFKLNVGELISSRGKPEKLTQKGALNVLPIDEYVISGVNPITGNNELLNVSVKVNGDVLVNINVFVIELNDNNQLAPTTFFHVLIKLLTL
jgi:hypothetical protein